MATNKSPRRMARPPYVGEAGGTDTDASQATDANLIGATEKRITKQSLVIDLLHRDGGASLTAIVESTGWLPHTARAALTGLRKKGHAIERTSVDGEPATQSQRLPPNDPAGKRSGGAGDNVASAAARPMACG